MPPTLERPNRNLAPLFAGQLPENTDFDLDEFAARSGIPAVEIMQDIHLNGLPHFEYRSKIWINTTEWREWCKQHPVGTAGGG